MTDIVEQAARVLYEHYSRSDGLDVTAQESAQALADAGLLAQPARTVPTRDEIADVILDTHLFDGGTPIDTADAILELLAGQPTVEEVKAQALEEAAELLDQPRALWFEFGIGVTVQDDTNRDIELTTWLRHHAQQHRDGK